MKSFVAALFVLALALGVQSSFLPFPGLHTEVAGHGLSFTAVSSPAVVAAPWAPWPLAHAGAVTVVGPSAPVVVAPPLVGHDATYLAKTRGAVHTAPLAGHVNSVANVNLLAPPGTH
uniref:Adult cuticle protein 1 n=1 Tax=Glossina brevipalpis TaxID=37001 RepID=A0A1A9W1T9_9MUSC